jgi:hypothetical protein
MADTVYFRGKRSDLAELLRRVPALVENESGGLVEGFKLRVANAVLSEVQQDFETKARGGKGRDGIKWPPLKRETVAGRTPPKHKAKDERPRGLLTVAQDALFRRTFGRVYHRLKFDLGDAAAKAQAGKIAWAAVKAAGGKTRLATLGDRQVEILRDTGLLFRSFTPGVGETTAEVNGQVVRIPTGRIVVGSNVKPQHHAGIPGKLPARPFWPLGGAIPGPWWEGIRLAAIRGLQRLVRLSVEGGRR